MKEELAAVQIREQQLRTVAANNVAVLFDFDGTLGDTEVGLRAWRLSCRSSHLFHANRFPPSLSSLLPPPSSLLSSLLSPLSPLSSSPPVFSPLSLLSLLSRSSLLHEFHIKPRDAALAKLARP